MERLTERDGDKAYYPFCFKECGGIGCSAKCDTCEFDYNVVKKLAEYEDMEENGLLVRLPCKIGDFLFAPTRDFVSIFQVIEFEYSGYDVFVKWKLCKGITGRFQIDGIYKNEIGKTVFLTQTEAEAKLKEMEGEK